MPRRISTRTVTSSATSQAVPEELETPYDANIHQLRRHWKWAAFSQFFHTFSPLLAMSDVTLVDVENDLVHSTNQVLSRIMQRLLITLTQDRKISAESWQNVLRRQYQRRDPEASPIGLPLRSKYFIVESSRASTAPPGTLPEPPTDERERVNESAEHSVAAHSPDNAVCAEATVEDPEHVSIAKVEEEDTPSDILEEQEKQTNWLDLSMLTKLESLYTVAEWQFQNPHRVRQQMKTDDEQATWRIEPIGYDAKRNAYWLIGDRLWIQREPPRPNLKRKRKPDGNSKGVTKTQPQSQPMKRQRTDLHMGSVGQSSVTRSTRNKAQSQSSPNPRGRAAKVRANQKLDAQARDLAEFRRQMTTSCTRTASGSPRKSTGIRVSARLRGTAVDDDEWQEVPDEWLAVSDTRRSHAKDLPPASTPSGKKRIKTGLESDDGSISELTELSDGEDDGEGEEGSNENPSVGVEAANSTSARNDPGVEAEDQQDEVAKSVDPLVSPPLPSDFVEWETICVTLEEWESFGQQFEKATHYAEKALHKVLQNIVLVVTTELREAEKKRHMEEAVVHRKRSSRIAMKEVEKEEQRAVTRKRLEEEEKTSRARRLEARQQKEQAERLKRENAREQRRKERELQEQQSGETCDEDSRPDDAVREKTNINLFPAGQTRVPVNPNIAQINGTGSGSRSPVENWELDCEVCGRKGVNQDDGVPLLCCGTCGKWQHIICHDKRDAMAGRPKRNWDAEDFICRQCRLMMSKSLSPSHTASLLSLGVDHKREQVSSIPAFYGSPSNYSRSHSNNGYYQNSPSTARYQHNHPDTLATVPAPSSYSYTPQSRSTSVTFAHYQPQQGGFSTSRPTYAVQDVNSPHHARYSITPTPHTVSTTGIAPYPSTHHTQALSHSTARSHEQWFPPSYPRTTNSYPINGGSPLHTQGVQPYYNGHAHSSYPHMRGTPNPTMLGQYAGLQHVPSYQHSK